MGYKNFIEELYKIIQTSNSGKEIIDRINSNKLINLDEDFETIYTEIRKEDRRIFSDFINELIQSDKMDLIKKVNANVILEYAYKAEDEKLTQFICNNFKEIVDGEDGYIPIEIIEPFMAKKEYAKDIKKGLPSVIRGMISQDRVQFIKYINYNQYLGDLEEYISDLMFVPEGKKKYGMNFVLSELKNTESLDKLKLLKCINDKMDIFINSFDAYDFQNLVSFFDTIKEIEEELPKESKTAQNLIDEVNKYISDNLEGILKDNKYNPKVIDSFRQFNINNSKFENMQDNIIESLYGADLLDYIKQTKGKEGLSKEWNYNRLIKELFKNNKEIVEDKTAQVTLSKLLQELCEHENIGIEDLEFGGEGRFNFNIKAGSYIMKIGESWRRTDKIPNDKRIIKPLLRQYYNQEKRYDKKIANIFIEIQNVVDVNWYKDLPRSEIKEQLYTIYRELRDRGIIWTDVKPENVGRLLKPNKENFEIEVLNKNGKPEKEELKADNYAVTFTGEEPDEILMPGELVIIDTDYIYNEEDQIEWTPKVSFYDEFEERYIEENIKRKNNIDTDDIKNIIEDKQYTIEDLNNINGEIDRACRSSKEIDSNRGRE